MDDGLIAQTRDLAVRYFGDNSDNSLAQVLQVVFAMRCLWSHSLKRGQQETDEPVSRWESSESLVIGENTACIKDWLFRR